MIDALSFPKLTPQNHRITSPSSRKYNCIAWAANDVTQWWDPTIYWPIPAGREKYSLAALQDAFASLGFTPISNAELERDVTKIALYADGPFYTHAARQ